MESRVELTQAELQRLQRILACEDLTRQRNLAVPFFVFAGILLIGFPLLVGLDPVKSLVALPFALAVLFVGMARLGHYKLFRMIHRLAAQCESQQERT